MLNARRHRCGDHAAFCAISLLRASAQRPKASMRRSRRAANKQGPVLRVLNARRHRCGDHTATEQSGLETGTSAQRPKASMRRSRYRRARRIRITARCSTPEGIDAAITNVVCSAVVFRRVLNARRHRCGDHSKKTKWLGTPAHVLNARRHRCGDHLQESATGTIRAGAQRPKASMRRSRSSDVIRSAAVSCSTPEGIDAAITRTRRPGRRA